MQRVRLTEETARKHLSFTYYWVTKIKELVKIIISDETSIQNNSSNPNVFVFRFP
ncbi:hypothetical protein V8C42DRAFT_315171 [Trichoderma barbatum]